MDLECAAATANTDTYNDQAESLFLTLLYGGDMQDPLCGVAGSLTPDDIGQSSRLVLEAHDTGAINNTEVELMRHC